MWAEKHVISTEAGFLSCLTQKRFKFLFCVVAETVKATGNMITPVISVISQHKVIKSKMDHSKEKHTVV